MTGLASVVSTVVEDAKLAIAAGRQQTAALTRRQRYALDPFALLDAGHVRILAGLKDDEASTTRIEVFRPYEHQRHTLAAWIDCEHLAATARLRFHNLLIEKSRQMGETWILAYGVWWATTFHDVQGLVMHLKQAKVADGGTGASSRPLTPRSFFGKVRFINQHLDAAAAGIDRPRLAFTPFSNVDATITNADRPGSSIVGSGQSDDPGRGDTLDFVIQDEAAHIERSERVHESVSRSCPQGKVYNSTPHGQSNVFYRIRRDRPKGWSIARYHWSQHPAYGAGGHIAGADPDCARCRGTNAGLPWRDLLAHRYPGKLTSPWYDQAVLDLTDEQVARQLDIDYVGSLEARVYPEWQPETHVVDRRLFDPALPVELGWDFGWSDYTSIVICQDGWDSYRVVGELETNHALPEQIADGLIAVLSDLGIAHPLDRSWTRQLLCVADVAGNSKNAQTGTSLWDTYATHGWVMTGKYHLISPTIVSVGRLLLGKPKPLLVSGADCPKFCEHVANTTWPTDSEGKRRPGSTEPLHDEHSHMTSAFRYLIAHKFPPPSDDQALPPPPWEPYDGVVEPGVRPGMVF